jgi:lactoylglutathione lyase
MKLNHTMLRVRDLDRSLKFYCEFLGLEEVRRHDLGDEATLVFLSDAERSHHIELTFNKDGREYELGNQFGHLALVTDDLDSIVAKVESGRHVAQKIETLGQEPLHLRKGSGRLRD